MDFTWILVWLGLLLVVIIADGLRVLSRTHNPAFTRETRSKLAGAVGGVGAIALQAVYNCIKPGGADNLILGYQFTFIYLAMVEILIWSLRQREKQG